jgi:protein-S-isoprenylcysteine O-methyltransferase Ste14
MGYPALDNSVLVTACPILPTGKKEEVDVEKEFGNEYIEYKKRTKMFIPYIL